VLEDRPLAFIHVQDAADALLAAAAQVEEQWQVVNAAPEVATVGQVARTVERLMQERGRWALLQGAASSEAGFQVASRLDFTPRFTLRAGLGDVLGYFLSR
jgi:nucleoside-diphosphate-sugar epimerase